MRNYLDIKKGNTILTKAEVPFKREESGVLTESKDKIKRPKLYKVIMHNDDYTTMEFVVFILQMVFKKNVEEAQQIMLIIHNVGYAVCGVYTYEIAETKVGKVIRLAQENSHPLKCTMESE